MGKHETTTIASILLALVGLSVVAALVSAKGKTTGVLTAGGGALSQAICTALSPVTGGSCGSLTENVTSSITF